MYANQSMEQRRRFFGGLRNRKQSVTERKLSDSAHQDIKKSQSLCHRTRAQIACGICYKSFDLKSITSDIKGEKLGQFSVCRGSKLDISFFFFFDKGGANLCFYDTSSDFSAQVSVSLFSPSKDTGLQDAGFP